jgi:hypothetical protein
LRDDVGGVSDPGAPNSGNSRDVLSSLPSTRPQRRSPKRDASKQGDGSKRAKPKPRAKAAGAPSTHAAAKPRPQAAAPRRQSARPGKTVAAQGYHPVPDTTPVQPPTGTEILASAVQAAGEVAQFGLTMGERLLRAAGRDYADPRAGLCGARGGITYTAGRLPSL